MSRTVTLSKHEIVVDRDVIEDIWEIAHGAEALEKDYTTEETIRILKSYEAKAHKYDSLKEENDE